MLKITAAIRIKATQLLKNKKIKTKPKNSDGNTLRHYLEGNMNLLKKT